MFFAEKYSWKKYKPLCPPSYWLDSIATVLLDGWILLFYNECLSIKITQEG